MMYSDMLSLMAMLVRRSCRKVPLATLCAPASITMPDPDCRESSRTLPSPEVATTPVISTAGMKKTARKKPLELHLLIQQGGDKQTENVMIGICASMAPTEPMTARTKPAFSNRL